MKLSSLMLATLLVHFLVSHADAFPLQSRDNPSYIHGKQSTSCQIQSVCSRRVVGLIQLQASTVEDFGVTFDDADRQRRSKCWILLVDDEEPIRKAVGQLLYDRGYQVTVCGDANTALKVAKSRRQSPDDETTTPDCIVSDIRMPEISGLQMLQTIRQDSALSGVPVILLTAKSMTQDRIVGYDYGADAYLTKPFDPEELVAIIDNVIDRRTLLSGSDLKVEDLKQDLEEMRTILLKKGGSGVGNGWVEQTNVFLSSDEQQVINYLCEGLTNKDIATNTFLSTRRVEQLLTGMFRRTQTKNRTELVRWAMSTGNAQL